MTYKSDRNITEVLKESWKEFREGPHFGHTMFGGAIISVGISIVLFQLASPSLEKFRKKTSETGTVSVEDLAEYVKSRTRELEERAKKPHLKTNSEGWSR